jgi:hypothetical protein
MKGAQAPTVTVKVSPNPASSEVRFDLQGAPGGMLSVIEVTGRPVWSGQSAEAVTLDVSSLPAGLYRYLWQSDSPEPAIPASGSFVVIRD